jgi:hypothetical protein
MKAGENIPFATPLSYLNQGNPAIEKRKRKTIIPYCGSAFHKSLKTVH